MEEEAIFKEIVAEKFVEFGKDMNESLYLEISTPPRQKKKNPKQNIT